MKNRNLYVHVRDVALALRKHGVSAEVAADATGVSKGTIVAWWAHETMGTYRK